MMLNFIRFSRFLQTFGLLILFSSFAFSQNGVSGIPQSKVDNARNYARFTVEHFIQLLNTISQTQDRSDIDNFIEGALKGKKQLFKKGEDPCIKSDLSPNISNYQSVPANSVPDNVSTYLGDFDFFYNKYDEETIFYSDILVSDLKVKRSGELYLWIKYKSLFKGKHKHYPEKPFSETDRIIQVVIDTVDTWKYFIDWIDFFDPNTYTADFWEVETRQEIAQKLQKQIKKAEDFHNIYDYEKALANYKIADGIRPDDPDVEKAILILDRKLNDRKNRTYYGTESFTKRIEAEQDDPDLYYERGLNYEQTKQIDKAIEDYKHCLKITNNKYRNAFVRLAHVLHEGSPEEAISYYNQALLLDPEDQALREKLVELLYPNYPQEALTNLKYLLRKNRDPFLLFKIGKAHQSLEQNVEAIKNFLEASELFDKYAEAYFEAAITYLSRSSIDEAEQNFQKAYELEPENYGPLVIEAKYRQKAESWKNIPSLAGKAEQLAEQWKSLTQLATERGSPPVDDNSAKVEALLEEIKENFCINNFDQALDAIAKLEKVESKGIFIPYLRALVYYEKGDAKSVKNLTDVCIKNYPEQQKDLIANLHVLNGYLLLNETKYIDATFEFDKALKLNNQHPEANHALFLWYTKYGTNNGELKGRKKKLALEYQNIAKETKPSLFSTNMGPAKSMMNCQE